MTSAHAYLETTFETDLLGLKETSIADNEGLNAPHDTGNQAVGEPSTSGASPQTTTDTKPQELRPLEQKIANLDMCLKAAVAM